MEKINLLNKIVKVYNIEDLMFYFPGFTVKKYVDSLDMGSNIIYTGILNKKALNILENCTYIATQGLYQYDLTDRKAKLEFVYSKWGRDVPSSIMQTVDYYDDNEFSYCCKIYWVSGRWPYRTDQEVSIYELYSASVKPINDFIKEFFVCVEDYPVGVIEQSFFTFLLRAKHIDDQNVSPTYKRLLKSFSNTSGKKVKKAMLDYLDSSIGDKELKFIEFILNLRA